jgi:hypothetical protein
MGAVRLMSGAVIATINRDGEVVDRGTLSLEFGHDVIVAESV